MTDTPTDPAPTPPATDAEIEDLRKRHAAANCAIAGDVFALPNDAKWSAMETVNKFSSAALFLLPALLARLDAAEAGRRELLEEVGDSTAETAVEICHLGDDGWYCTNARSTAVWACERLVELGRWEKHPDPNKGVGRVQYYRPIPAPTESEATDA